MIFNSFAGEGAVEVENGDNDIVNGETGDQSKEPVDVFYPTDKWQTVKKGMETVIIETGMQNSLFLREWPVFRLILRQKLMELSHRKCDDLKI